MKYSLLLFLIGISISLTSGQLMVKGKVVDEDHNPLVGATVVILESIDSSMISFCISDDEGEFLLEDVSHGQSIIQISFLSFLTLFEPISLTNKDKVINIGSFSLKPSSEILQEVTIQAEHIPMGVLGDTINYNAAAFQVKPGASVEDLLKRLPGVEVQRDGSIKAMGRDVENVLVDGKEFFGDDPKIATQNLEAEAVDKVQVYDKKSEIAEFTGIDDGIEEKTINLKLKEEYKKGGFGNIDINAGSESRYETKINYNRFSPRMQAALIGGANNTNKQAFSFNEYISFMGGLANAISGSNQGMKFGEFGQGAAPQGLSDNISTGLNFNYDFSSKLKLSSYYFYLRSDKNLLKNTDSEQFSLNDRYFTSDTLSSSSLRQDHRLNLKLEYKPNPTTQVLIKNTLSNNLGNDNSLSNTSYLQGSGLLNFTSSNLVEIVKQSNHQGSIIFRKKYKKKGRNWIQNGKMNHTISNQESYVSNFLRLRNEEVSLNQFQEYYYNKRNISFSSKYTEPLSKQLYLSLSYYFESEKESPEKAFFDLKDGFEILNTDLSAQFNKTNTINRGKVSMRKNLKRVKLNAALSYQDASINGETLSELTSLSPMTFTNRSSFFLPSISSEFDLSKNKSIEIKYWTQGTLPSLEQLSPLPNNSNPNVLILGNPKLSPTYNHNIDLHYRAIDQFNFKSLFLTINFLKSTDRVINEIAIDEEFIRTFKPINSDNFWRLTGFASYAAPIRLLKLKFNIRSRFTSSIYNTSLNGTINNVSKSNVSFDFTLENRNKELIDIAGGISIEHNTTKYDLQNDFNQKFFNYSLYIDGIIQVGKTWTVASKFDLLAYSDEYFSEGRKIKLWDLSFRKSINEDKVAILLSFNDLLNQNRGIERFGGLNSLNESRFNTLSRYITLGIKFKLGKRKSHANLLSD